MKRKPRPAVPASLLAALLATACASQPAPPVAVAAPPPAQVTVRAIVTDGIDAPDDLADALAAFAGRPMSAELARDAGEALRTWLDWQEWQAVAVEPALAPDADGVLHLVVVAVPPPPIEQAPEEYFDIAMPGPPDEPPPEGLGGARVETALDDSFKPWLDSPARVLIDAADRRMYVKRSDAIVSYAVAVGTARTPTPEGEYWVEAITRDPTWYPPASIRREHAARGKPLPAFVPPGRANPLGGWFVRLQNSIGIHGTNQPRSIGTASSHGCVRMHDRDVAELAALLRTGDHIRIVRAHARAAQVASGGGRGAMQ
jgi:lipoprotein-anchoring transpeptidase ErfK/SrfK